MIINLKITQPIYKHLLQFLLSDFSYPFIESQFSHFKPM